MTSGQTWTCVPSGNVARKWGALSACATVLLTLAICRKVALSVLNCSLTLCKYTHKRSSPNKRFLLVVGVRKTRFMWKCLVHLKQRCDHTVTDFLAHRGRHRNVLGTLVERPAERPPGCQGNHTHLRLGNVRRGPSEDGQGDVILFAGNTLKVNSSQYGGPVLTCMKYAVNECSGTTADNYPQSQGNIPVWLKMFYSFPEH